MPRSAAVPSTTAGRFYIREGDRNRPIVGDDVLRLASDRATFSWEALTALRIERDDVDSGKLAKFVDAIRRSDRVKASVKEKSDAELMDHYLLAQGTWLTNLGILCVGRRPHRAGLAYRRTCRAVHLEHAARALNEVRRLSRGRADKPASLTIH